MACISEAFLLTFQQSQFVLLQLYITNVPIWNTSTVQYVHVL